jgi:hypothetical protein
VAELARQVQHVTAQTVKLVFADQGYTGDTAAQPHASKALSCRCTGSGYLDMLLQLQAASFISGA